MTAFAWLAAVVSIALVFPPSLRFVNEGTYVTVAGREILDRSVPAGCIRAILFSAAAAWLVWPATPTGDARTFALAVLLSSGVMGVVILLALIRSCTSPYRTRGGY